MIDCSNNASVNSFSFRFLNLSSFTSISFVVANEETIKTIMALAEIGIEPEKIRIVFNKVESDVADEFPHVLNYVKKEKNAVADVKAAIFENELFDALGAKGTTINALLSDDTDYKALIKNNPDASAKERSHWGDMHGLKALARSVNRNLDSVFSTLFK